MFYQEFSPHKILRKQIHSYFYFHSDPQDSIIKSNFCLPSGGGSDFIINFGDPLLTGFKPDNLEISTGSWIIGTISRSISIKPTGKVAYIVVRFLPGQMTTFFPPPANELSDMNIELELLWGSFGRIIKDKVMGSSSISQAIKTLDKTFLKSPSKVYFNDYRINHAIKIIQLNRGQVSIMDLVKVLDLSRRQFERLFMKMVGITPKRFCRIIRFRSVFTYLDNNQHNGWADVATACGYSDQAHFIRECKFFTGFSPITYLQNLTPLEKTVLKVDASMSHLFNT